MLRCAASDAQRQLQLLSRRLRSCVSHATELDSRYHRDVHGLKYQLAQREEAAEETAKAHSHFRLAVGGVGIALLCAGAAGGVLARRGIVAERAVAKELGAGRSCSRRSHCRPPLRLRRLSLLSYCRRCC
jgi:hypothetical protein